MDVFKFWQETAVLIVNTLEELSHRIAYMVILCNKRFSGYENFFDN